MSFAEKLRCTNCGTEYSTNDLMNLCPKDNKPLEIIINVERIKHERPNFQWYRPELKSMWRFGSLLALDINQLEDRKHIISLGEGYTPEINISDYPLAHQHGIKLFIKDEGQPHHNWGANPTGSFKDRGMSMAVSMAKFYGLNKVVVPTQGNAGDSLVEYALKAGIESKVIMPDDTPMPILGKVLAMSQRHSKVSAHLVKGTIKEAGELMKSQFLSQGFFNMATFQEPGWRIEGKKTLGYELAEPQNGLKDRWQLPDVVLYPTGGGTGILGMWKAFDEMQAMGLIDQKRPRIISVQSTSTSPIINAFNANLQDTTPVSPGQTIATGLNVPGGVGHSKVLEIIDKSRGGAIAVDEGSIEQSLKKIYNDYQIWICPEGAATIGALESAIERNWIKTGDKVVAFNTGSFEKYLPNVRHLIY